MLTSTYIREYLAEKFGKVGKFSANGKEFIMPSLLVENDWKRHLSINADSGLWQDFKSGEVGNFVSLYSTAEGITLKKAKTELLVKTFFFEDGLPLEDIEEIQTSTNLKSELEKDTLIPIVLESDDCPEAWAFLWERKLFNLDKPEEEQFYYCKNGKYSNRIIIPFKHEDYIYYFQARALSPNHQPKYLNPPADSGVRPSTVLYPFDEEADQVVVCEGPLDAISLQIQGINATCTLGSSMSSYQINILRNFKGDIILGYDNDEAGYRGIGKADTLRKEQRMSSLYLVHPPSEVKDWNEAHIKNYNLKKYISINTQKFDYEYKMNKVLSSL